MPLHRTSRRAGLALAFAALVTACGSNGAVTTPSTPQAAAIRIDPAAMNVAVGADSQLVAVVTSTAGTVLSSPDVRWNGTDGAVISVSQTGVVHGVSAGTATVTAVTGSHIAETKVTVVATP